MSQTNILFLVSQVRAPRFGRRKGRRREKGREEEEEEEKEKKRYGSLDFCMGFGFVWITKGLYEFLACSKPRVLLGDHPNPRIVEVVWVKP